MHCEKVADLDQKTNKVLNKSIIFFLKRLKTLVGYYAQCKGLTAGLPIDAIRNEPEKSIRESILCQVVGRVLIADDLAKEVKKVNTFYLYLRRKNFKDALTKKKHKLRQTMLEAELLLAKNFPVDVLLQVAENEAYNLREITRDRRNINYESYFTRGGRVTAEISAKSKLLSLVWEAYQETCLLLAKYTEYFESDHFYPFYVDLL